MENTTPLGCATCGGKTDGFKCAMCGEVSAAHNPEHACGGEMFQARCAACNEAESKCTCALPAQMA